MILFFQLLVALLLGFFSCLLVFKETGAIHRYTPANKKKGAINFRFLLNLSFPIGVGFSSVIFILFNLLGFSSLSILFIEVGLVIFLFLKVKNSNNPFYQFQWFDIEKSSKPGLSGYLNGLTKNSILLLAMGIYFYSWLLDVGVYFFDSIQNPHGLWDAWSCWNLNAKFISNSPHGWPALIHQMNPLDFAPDHPLLQKGFIAQCWILMQNESIWVPVVSSFIFTFCTIGLLSASICFFKNKMEGLIAGLILLCTPFFMIMGDSQYADNTVGFFYLATIVLLTFARQGGSLKPRLMIAAGITTGLAAWSKSEGLLFIVCLFSSQIILLFFKTHRKLLFREFKYFLLGMIPILLLVAYFKIFIAPPNRILEPQGAITLVKLMDYSRYVIAFNWFEEQFRVFGKWAFNPWWLFLFGIIYKGIRLKEYKVSVISNFVLLFLMLTGFFFIQIIAPLDIYFYLSTSVHRLLFQLFPSFIFLYFLLLKKDKL